MPTSREPKKPVSAPERFLWGVATSSHQIEGDNRHNDWWRWEEQGNIVGGVRSGAATDHWNRWREDLQLAKSLGVNAYRFSIEWSRLEPEEGRFDDAALDWYEALVAECERLDIVPMCTLHHFTVPAWLADRGGWTWEHAPGRFKGFVRRVVARLGLRIPLWCTINEPNILLVGQFLGGFMPPAIYSPTRYALASRNLLRAHVHAYDILHGQKGERTGPWKDMPLRVGIAHNLVDFRPYRAGHLIDRLLASRARRFYNTSWIDAVTGRKQHFGLPFLVPYPRQVWEARRRRTADFIGVNYYTKSYVCWGPQKEEAQYFRSRFFPVGVVLAKSGEAKNDMGWAIHPEGLGRMFRYLKRYKLPIFVTENGIADANDEKRGKYLQDHVAQVHQARERGHDVRGYFHWSLLDNFEWREGYWPRFGIFHVDYQTFERRPRPSAEVYRRLIAESSTRPEPAVDRAFAAPAASTR